MKGYDGSAWKDAVQISARVDGTPVAGSYVPGKIVFRTCKDASGLKDRMVIRANGYVGINTTNPQYELDVNGDVHANSFNTGDIFFQKDGKQLWRMFEDENGLYVENLETGKIYTIVSRNGNAHANNIGFYMMTIGIGAMIGAAIAIAWRRRN